MKNKTAFLLFCLVAAGFFISCCPSYPREKIVEFVKKECQKEYKVDVEAGIKGNTLAVRLPIKGLFEMDAKKQLSKDAMKKLNGVMLTIARAALSCDESINFYTAVVYDKDIPGAEVIITRYVKDLKRFVVDDISLGESYKRSLMDKRFNLQQILDRQAESFTFEETKLQNFICSQAVNRINQDFKENKSLAGKFSIISCQGALDRRIFKFSIDARREGLPMSELLHGTSWHEKVLELALKHIAQTIYIYEFKDFDKIEVTNKFDNKNLSIGKNEINKWRKRRIKID